MTGCTLTQSHAACTEATDLNDVALKRPKKDNVRWNLWNASNQVVVCWHSRGWVIFTPVLRRRPLLASAHPASIRAIHGAVGSEGALAVQCVGGVSASWASEGHLQQASRCKLLHKHQLTCHEQYLNSTCQAFIQTTTTHLQQPRPEPGQRRCTSGTWLEMRE
jgi:hypothetical protein